MAPRRGQAVVSLADGSALVAGGALCLGKNEGALASDAEVLDAKTVRWRKTGPLAQPRFNAGAVLLPSGRALLAGGGTEVSEEYDPAGGGWSRVSDLPVARSGTLIGLRDGRVLAAGGGDAAAAIYDPAAQIWNATASPAAPPGPAAVALSDGRAMFIGGGNGSSVDAFDPASGRWVALAPMQRARSGLAAAVLQDGGVLVTGGETPFTPPGVWDWTYEIYDPKTNAWSAVQRLPLPVTSEGALVVQPSGVVLLLGGEAYTTALGRGTAPTDTVQSYEPAGGWKFDGFMASQRSALLAVPFGGRALVIGGRWYDCAADKEAELYGP